MTSASLSVCRFCLATQEESDQIQVYSEMLKDTFNIELSGVSGGGGACPDCVHALLDARRFKRQVLHAEHKFATLLAQCDIEAIQGKHSTTEVQVKIEDRTESELDQSADELPNEDYDIREPQQEVVKRRAREERGAKGRGSQRRRGDVPADCKTAESARRQQGRGPAPALRRDSLLLLAHSTAVVFQWHASRYRCFCCQRPFAHVDALRQHADAHTLAHIEKKIIHQQNRLVKVDISILNCKLCGEALDHLPALKQHLIERHKLEFTLKEDLLVPFKLNTQSFQCQICSENFSVFRHLNIHMNRHFQKQVCHICGAGFANLVYLNLHRTRAHRPLKCNECQIEFATKVDKREHDARVHGVKSERKLRFPCPFCEERYFQEHLRVLHLVEKHGLEKPEHSCSICGKIYVTKSLRNNHLKNVHMKQKNKECEVCRLRFYTNSDLNRHKVTHTGEKNFSCGSCNNLYATKDSLNRHVKRTHST